MPADEEPRILDIGSIHQLTSQKRPKKRHPIGFTKTRARKHGDRVPGSFPDVPRFDQRG